MSALIRFETMNALISDDVEAESSTYKLDSVAPNAEPVVWTHPLGIHNACPGATT